MAISDKQKELLAVVQRALHFGQYTLKHRMELARIQSCLEKFSYDDHTLGIIRKNVGVLA